MIDIFGTLGPACSNEDILERMFQEGMTGMRLNLSHMMLSDNEEQIRLIKKAASSQKKEAKILIDLQGPELRIGNLMRPLPLKKGDAVVLKEIRSPKEAEASAFFEDDPSEGQKVIPLSRTILRMMDADEDFLMDDGKILAHVDRWGENEVSATILRGGTLSSRKSITVKKDTSHLPSLTEADRINLKTAVRLGVVGVMQPFVRGKSDLEEVRGALSEVGGTGLKIYAKIENRMGVEKIDELIGSADEIVIARGDLGNAMPLWELPGVQKQIAKRCNASGRAFMVVTQMLASMEHAPVPTRAEVSDIYNAVIDGASSVMVTGETAVGDYPADVIRYLANTAREAERARN